MYNELLKKKTIFIINHMNLIMADGKFFELYQYLCRVRNNFKQADIFYSMLTELRKKEKPHKLFLKIMLRPFFLYSEMFIVFNYVQKFDKQMEMLHKTIYG